MASPSLSGKIFRSGRRISRAKAGAAKYGARGGTERPGVRFATPEKMCCTVRSISFRGGEISLKLVDAVGVLITFDWSKLSPEERVRRCRDFASEALAMAEAKQPGEREPHIRLAAEWLKLAREMEQHLDEVRPSLNS